MFYLVAYAALGLAVVMLFAKSHRADPADHVTKSVLRRIRDEYQDVR